MNKFFKRIGAILLALTLCFGTTLTAFAAEDENVKFENETVTTLSNVLTGPRFQVGNSKTILYKLDSGFFGATFRIFLLTNTGVKYRVILTSPDGQQFSETVYDNSTAKNLHTFFYAPAGTYTLTVSRLENNNTDVTALLEIVY